MVFPCVSCVRLRPGVPLACLISLVFSLRGFVYPLFFGMTALPVPMPRQVYRVPFFVTKKHTPKHIEKTSRKRLQKAPCGFLFGTFLVFFGHFFDVFAGVRKKVLPRWFLEVFWPPLTLANLSIP